MDLRGLKETQNVNKKSVKTIYDQNLRYFPYPIYDLTKNSKAYFWPVSDLRYNYYPSSDQRLITVNILMKKWLPLKNIAISSQVQTPYPIYDQNGRNQVK